MTTEDAQKLVSSLVERGRKQTNDVLGDLEQLLGRGRDEIEGRTGEARKRGTDAARKARKQVEGATKDARDRRPRPPTPCWSRPTAPGAWWASGPASRSPATTT